MIETEGVLMRVQVLLASIALALSAAIAPGVALAEPPPGTTYEPPPEGYDQTQQTQLEPAQDGQLQVVESGQQQPPPGQPQPVQPAQTAEEGRGIEYGAHLIVPIFLTNDLAGSVGIGIQGRAGWEFPGGFALELNIGIQGNGFALYDPVTDLDAEGVITAVWIGGGARYAFLNPSAFVPFIGAGIALDFWGTTYDWSDGTTEEYQSQITFATNALVGAAIELSPYIGLEFGLQVNYSFPGNVTLFDGKGQLWISPFAGGTLYF